MKLDFAEWLKINEAGTSTGDVAVFARRAIPALVRRATLGPWAKEDPFFKKKKKKKEESVAPQRQLQTFNSEPILKLVTADDSDVQSKST